jgi:uroporphyrinogen III methyltransferase/synthase
MNSAFVARIRLGDDRSMTKPKATGICQLVGAGPGDLGLVTLRAKECLEAAEVVVYDYLCNPDMLAWAPPAAEIIYAGKKAGAHTLKQDEINALLVEKTRAGKRVVRLKGGDPFVFGRGGEEALALGKARVKFEVVPGISSAIAGPAYAGIPVTQRGCVTQLTIFTGHEDPEKGGSTVDLAQLARAPGTKVMLMGVERLESISRQFIEAGADPALPVALVRWATTPRQETLTGTLGDIAGKAAAAGFEPPAVAVLGEVVHLRAELNWFEKRPLFGRRIVVTRTRKQAGALSGKLRALGADVLEIPTIRIEPPTELRLFAELVRDAHTYDWILFTSPNGADAFFEMFYRLYEDARDIGGARIGVVGPATAARVREFRLKVDVQPEKNVAEALVAALQKESSVENVKILLVRAEVTREVVAQSLTRLGAIVDEAVAYRTVPENAADGKSAAPLDRFRTEGADLITFASSSSVENFLALKLTLPSDLRVATLGPITSKTARDAGLRVDIESPSADLDAFVRSITAHFARHSPE